MARDLWQVLEAILAGVVVLDAEGRVEELNSVASRMLEYSREAAVGHAIEELMEAEHGLARLGRRVLARGVAVSESSHEIEHRNGPSTAVDVAASPLFDGGGRVDGCVLVLRDRSAHRRLEKLESERERLEAFGHIAAGLAHEIKNPLGGIQGAGELLARRAEDLRARQTADLVVRESSRIASLVDDFMVFARGDQLRLAQVNVHRVLDGVLELLGHDPLAEAVHFERLYDPSIPEILADPDRLTQVFLNLARNALQAMEGCAESALRVTTRMTLDHRIAVEEGRALATLAIWVDDNGLGMSQEELREATTPFFTARAGGTGLGLAVSEYWIAQHHGELHLESEKGVGTRARVTLPLRRTT